MRYFMVYEKAGNNEIKELTELRIEYLIEDHGDIPEDKLRIIEDSLPSYFRDHLNKDLLVYICRTDGIIAGCCFLYISEKPPNPSFINGRTGTVLNVYTRPQFRRKGIAGGLIKMMLAESERMKLDFVELKATDAGYHLYRSLGFEDAASKYHSMKFIIDKRNDI